MIRIWWNNGTVHTACDQAGQGRAGHMPLQFLNYLWHEGKVCRTCIPSPVLRRNPKFPWPWNPELGILNAR